MARDPVLAPGAAMAAVISGQPMRARVCGNPVGLGALGLRRCVARHAAARSVVPISLMTSLSLTVQDASAAAAPARCRCIGWSSGLFSRRR